MKIERIQGESRSEKAMKGPLGFGKTFTDHMLVMDYEAEKGWHSMRIQPYEEIPFSPATIAFHYGQAIFEGMKAFRTKDGQVKVFRPKLYLERLNRSADALCIPRVDTSELYDGLFQLLEIEKAWVPDKAGTALYIRPLVVAVEASVSVRVSSAFKLFIMLSPVGAYYEKGFDPISIKVEDYYVRAVKGGLGQAKTPANYAMSLAAHKEALQEGYDQVLWLDGVHRRFIEEVGTMNIFFKINGQIITPPLQGSILAGITRQTVIELARSWGMEVQERQLAIEEIYDMHAKGLLEEVFGSGTAAVVSPVGELTWRGEKMVINNNITGEYTQKLYNYITGVQYGHLPDTFHWMETV